MQLLLASPLIVHRWLDFSFYESFVFITCEG